MSKCEMCHYPNDYHSKDCSEQLKHNIDVYKNALNYFVKEGGRPAEDIRDNLLKELEG